MGSSGAGKTSLLNVIAGYDSGGKTSGDILVNGEAIGTGFMRQLSAFVHQADVLLQSVTVREAIRMAAFLRLPSEMSDEEKNHRVEEVIRWLNLVKCADNQIGSPEKKGISGGERRRVSVAIELVRNPSILYLDESAHTSTQQREREQRDTVRREGGRERERCSISWNH